MAKLRILFNNIVDTATVTASPALLSGKPETNLQRQERSLTARSTSLTAQELRFSWPAAQRVNMIALRYHNLTAAAQLAAPTYSDSAFTTSIAANAAANCFAYSGFGVEDVLTDADFRVLKNSARYLTLATNVQSMKAVLTDAANPDGYFDLSRVFIGEYLEFSYGVPYGGAPLAFIELGSQSDMDDGSIASDKGARRRQLTLSAEMIPAEEWARLLAGLRRVGRSADMWVSVFPEDGTYLEPYYQGAFKLVENPTLDRHFYGFAQTRLTLMEG